MKNGRLVRGNLTDLLSNCIPDKINNMNLISMRYIEILNK